MTYAIRDCLNEYHWTGMSSTDSASVCNAVLSKLRATDKMHVHEAGCGSGGRSGWPRALCYVRVNMSVRCMPTKAAKIGSLQYSCLLGSFHQLRHACVHQKFAIHAFRGFYGVDFYNAFLAAWIHITNSRLDAVLKGPRQPHRGSLSRA